MCLENVYETYLYSVNTDPGIPTAVESWAFVVQAPCFILVKRTVADAIAAEGDRKAVRTWAQEVGVWTRAGKVGRFVSDSVHLLVEAIARKVNGYGKPLQRVQLPDAVLVRSVIISTHVAL